VLLCKHTDIMKNGMKIAHEHIYLGPKGKKL
jgi:hypothetical protein